VCAPLFFSFLAVFSNPHRFISRRRWSSSPTSSLDLPYPVILVVDGPARPLRPRQSASGGCRPRPCRLVHPHPRWSVRVGHPCPRLSTPVVVPSVAIIHTRWPLHHSKGIIHLSLDFLFCVAAIPYLDMNYATSSMLDIFMLHLIMLILVC
jgi:energy-converting hydrogenase Eha subunit C